MLIILKTLTLTGLGYGATLLYTYVIIANVDAETIGRLNKYESILAIIASLISLGVVQDASRNIAINKNKWLQVYYDAQSCRVSLALLISVTSICFFLVTRNELYLLGLTGLAMALSGEYALYAIGRPTVGATASFFRAALFSLLMLVVVSVEKFNINAATLTIAWSISFILCGFIASRQLNVKYFICPGIPEKKALKTIGLIALLVFIYSNIKPAFILFISEYITKEDSVYYFEAYKLYFILFSVRRVIVQSLYKEIITSKSTVKHDFIIMSLMILSLLALWLIRILLDFFSIGFPGLTYEMLIDISIMTLMSCVFSSSFTKLFSLRKDFLIVIPVVTSLIFIYTGVQFVSGIDSTVSNYLYLLGATELVLSITSFFILKQTLVK